MISIETRIQIESPAAEVFAFVADQTNAPQWQDGLAEVRRVTDGPIGVGTEHVFVRQFAGRRIESRNRFTRFEPGRFVEFEIPEGWLTGTASYRVDPDRQRGVPTDQPDGLPHPWAHSRCSRRCWHASWPATPAPTRPHSKHFSSRPTPTRSHGRPRRLGRDPSMRASTDRGRRASSQGDTTPACTVEVDQRLGGLAGLVPGDQGMPGPHKPMKAPRSSRASGVAGR